MGGANVDKLWWIKCQSCGTYGPTKTTEAEAIAAWNRRARAALAAYKQENGE